MIISLSFSAFCFGYDDYHIIRVCGVVLEEEEGGGRREEEEGGGVLGFGGCGFFWFFNGQ